MRACRGVNEVAAAAAAHRVDYVKTEKTVNKQ
jgi:hypothetical protein